MIDREEIFREIQKGNWDFLISTLYKNKKDIYSDPILKNAADTFVSELLSSLNKTSIQDKELVIILERLFVIDSGGFYKLSEGDRKKLVCELVIRKADKIVEAWNYAKKYPEEEICQRIITEYEKLIPKSVKHSQSHKIDVTRNNNISNVDFRRNLFKSNQEIQLFYALKKTFDTYQIYPNVAVSCLINWDLIKPELTDEEQNYFFKSIIDFVIFDQSEGFIPKYFFELDSPLHDQEEIKKKDELKNSIFNKAGIEILRIRKMDKNVDENDFVKLIRELVKR